MIFSAVALVAFSFAGMANNENVGEKEVKKIDCAELAALTLEILDPDLTYGQDLSAAIFTTVVNACEIKQA